MKNHISGYWPAFSDRSKRYDNEVGRLGPRFDIYCTAPLESNRVRFLCAALTAMYNSDLSNYLVVFSGLDPADCVPKDSREGYKMWIEEAPFEATMHYFDLNCSDERRAQRLDLFRNRFVITKNDRAADWDEAMILQANVDYIDSLSRYDLECYARKFNVSLEKYVSRVKNNHKSFVKECHEGMEPA